MNHIAVGLKTRPILFRLGSVLGCILWCAVAFGRDFDIADSDSLAKVVGDLSPGDTVILRDGVWRDVDLVFRVSGRPDAPVTFRAASPGGVTIAGRSRIRVAGSHVIVSGFRFADAWHDDAMIQLRYDSKQVANDCMLRDCEIVDCNPPDPKIESKYVSIYGSRNTIERCHFAGKTNRGTTLVVWLDQGMGKHLIRNNHFGPRPELGTNGGETIRVGDSQTAHLSAGVVVEANWFDKCDGEAEIVSNKSCDNVYRGNLFTRCSGTLTLRHGHRCSVTDNIFLGEKARGSGGVRIIGRDHVVTNNHFESLEGDRMRSGLVVMNGVVNSPANGYEAVQGAIVNGNTFVECKRSIHFGGDNDHEDQVAPVQCRIIDNVIVSRRGPMIEVMDALSLEPAAANVFDGNQCYGDGDVGVEIAKVRASPKIRSVQAKAESIRMNASRSFNVQPEVPASH